MARKQSLLILGVWLMVLPFLGFPSSWKTSMLFLTGVALIIIYVRNKTVVVAKNETYIDNRNGIV